MSTDLIQNAGTNIKAEFDAQITTAKAYPRNATGFINNAIALATIDEETAQSCFYRLPPRKGADGPVEIKGPSIRLAEIAASCWGNLHAASRVIENDGKHITAEGVAWDLENNVKMSSEVKRSITYKNGGTFSSEMQGVASNAACAIALRNAIFKVVPKAFINRVYEAAMKHAVGTQETLPIKIQSTFNYFAKFGIQSDKITNFFNKPKEEFTQEDLVSLLGLATAVKDNMVTIDKVFVIEEETYDVTASQKISSLLAESKKQLAANND